jgi:Tfp pilus assembly protein PilF
VPNSSQSKLAARKAKRSRRGLTLALFAVSICALGVIVWLSNSTGFKQKGPAATNSATVNNTGSAGAREPDEIAADLITDANQDLAAGRAAQAVEKLRKAVELTPDNEDAHYNLGIALAAAGNAPEAQKAYEKALEIFPDYAEAHNNLGNLLMKQNNFGDATAHFKKALEISPDNPMAENNLGTALARHGDVAEALPHFSAAVRQKPDYLQARLNLANGYITLNRLDEAAQELNTILRMDPNYEPAQKAFARLRIRAPR